ncbi:unnamed protein product [Chironomus riparius]|uniref:Uncharacterized protein n=1 Tax=Chironomus riparius TaxID=315576 RepID=A0A9N9WVP9_9DIPT|nr:unnamed protein product [Chironomus riparius]
MRHYIEIVTVSIILVAATAYAGYVLSKDKSASSDITQLQLIQSINQTQSQIQNKHQNISNTAQNEIIKQIYEVIEHFKKEDPVGLPLPIPDPMEIPGITQQKLGLTLNLGPVFIHETSKFRIIGATIELDKLMQGSCKLSFDQLILRGNYTLRNIFGTSKGPFTIIIKNLNVDGSATLGVEKNGKLRALEIESDMHVKTMSVNFENLGYLKELFGSFVNSGDDSFFRMMKPYILRDSKEMIKKVINEQIDENLSQYQLMPNSIGAIDYAIAEARKFVKAKFDPFKMDEISNLGVFGYRVYDTELFGVSSFYRVGDLKTVIEDRIAKMTFEVGTQEIHGKTTWEVSIAKGMISRGGLIQFSIQYIKLKVKISQPIDLSKRLKVEDLRIDLGNIQILSSGMGTLDYVAEFLLNIIPNLLRDQIMDVIRKPIIERVQQYANRIDAEALIKDKVNEYFTEGTVSFESELKNEF